MKKEKPDYKVVLYSLIALAFVILSFTESWWYIIPAVILMFLNQRELMKK